MQEAQISFNQLALESIEIAAMVDPYQPDIPEGVEIPAVEAVNWVKSHRNCDLRPRLVDGSTGEARLIDTGAQLSATRRLPTDIRDDSVNLVAVNGSRINTYGERDIKIKIGRKEYKIPAVICDVKQDILGIDFIHKYKLSLQWTDDQSELRLVDKRAQISKALKIVTVPSEIARADHLEPVSERRLAVDGPQSDPFRPPATPSDVQAMHKVLFEVACVKRLGQAECDNRGDPLKLHDPEYQEMILRYPKLLDPTFKKGKPIHKVWHRIDTADHPPCKSKRRPILQNSEKAEKGRLAWENS